MQITDPDATKLVDIVRKVKSNFHQVHLPNPQEVFDQVLKTTTLKDKELVYQGNNLNGRSLYDALDTLYQTSPGLANQLRDDLFEEVQTMYSGLGETLYKLEKGLSALEQMLIAPAGGKLGVLGKVAGKAIFIVPYALTAAVKKLSYGVLAPLAGIYDTSIEDRIKYTSDFNLLRDARELAQLSGLETLADKITLGDIDQRMQQAIGKKMSYTFRNTIRGQMGLEPVYAPKDYAGIGDRIYHLAQQPIQQAKDVVVNTYRNAVSYLHDLRPTRANNYQLVTA